MSVVFYLFFAGAPISHTYTKMGKASSLYKFKICKSVHHHTIQINQPTRFSNFSSLLLAVYVQLNMFRGVLTPIIGSSTAAVAASGFTVGAWW